MPLNKKARQLGSGSPVQATDVIVVSRLGSPDSLGVTAAEFLNSGLALVNILSPAYGLVDDPTVDNSIPLQRVFDDAQAVYAETGAHVWIYMAPGRWLANNLSICDTSVATVAGTVGNVTLFGPGTLVQINEASNARLLNVNANIGGTSDVANNAVNINIFEITLEGQGDFREQCHLLNTHAVTNFLVQGVTFKNPRGDGWYLGSSNVAGQERHNKNCRSIGCRYEGNNHNRNGISIIDCDGFLSDKDHFYKIGKAAMPGCIDFEPNAAYSILNDIQINGATADSCIGDVAFGVNTSANAMTTPLKNIVIKGTKVKVNCTFGYGVLVRTVEAINVNTPPMLVDLSENVCEAPSCIPVGINKVKQARISANKANGTSAMEIGSTHITAATFMDVEVIDNMLQNCGYASGQMTVGSGSRLGIHRNHFIKPPAGVAYAVSFVGEGITTSSSDVSICDNQHYAGPDQTHTVHVFSHTLSPTTNYAENNTADTPLINEFAAVRKPSTTTVGGTTVTAPLDTAKNLLKSFPLKGHELGPNGFTRIKCALTFATSSSERTIRLSFDGESGTDFLVLSITDPNLLFLNFTFKLSNRNSVSSQIGYMEDIQFTPGATVTVTRSKNTSAVATSTTKSVALTVQKTTGSDGVTLDAYEQATLYVV